MFDQGDAMLSKRQQEIYDFVVRYAAKHGYPPTVREIGEEVGLASPSTVHAHLANLERAGLLRRDPTKPRALEIVGREQAAAAPPAPAVARDSRRLPLVGDIAAGGPLLAEENIEDYLVVPEPLTAGGDEFLHGDYVVVEKQATARDGEIVVALAGEDEAADEATVKRFFREKGRIRLQPENESLDPLYPAHVQILGKVIGVFRRV
jgi:repressor LexA